VTGSNLDWPNPPTYDYVIVRRTHFIALFLLTFVPASLAQSNGCDVLPSQAKLILDQRFANWRPKLLSDLSGFDRKVWHEEHPKECPGIVAGHFEQPDEVAYAVLLVPKTGHTASYKVIVLSQVSGEYAVRLLDHAEGSTYSDSGLVISKEPRGSYSEFGGAKSVHLKLDGVNVELLEKSSVLYYWSNGMYRSIQTSD